MPHVDIKTESAGLRFNPKISLEEYFVDLLGGLVPGVLFLAGSFFIFFPPFHALFCALSVGENRVSFIGIIKVILISVQNTPSAIWLILFLGGGLFAYTVGHLFYRHDPKIPDRKSFERLHKRYRRYAKRQKIEYSKNEIEADLACASADECEFPYPSYHKYLKKRGLKHLIPFVVWQDQPSYRSKTYINLLKIRLRYFFPDKCGTLIRNEAHVRLASSTWYVARLLTWFAMFGLILAIVSLFLSMQTDVHFKLLAYAFSWHMFAVLSPLMIMMLCFFIMRSILEFLHYQRLREVFYVLETAYTAFDSQKKLLNFPFDEIWHYEGKNFMAFFVGHRKRR